MPDNSSGNGMILLPPGIEENKLEELLISLQQTPDLLEDAKTYIRKVKNGDYDKV